MVVAPGRPRPRRFNCGRAGRERVVDEAGLDSMVLSSVDFSVVEPLLPPRRLKRLRAEKGSFKHVLLVYFKRVILLPRSEDDDEGFASSLCASSLTSSLVSLLGRGVRPLPNAGRPPNRPVEARS